MLDSTLVWGCETPALKVWSGRDVPNMLVLSKPEAGVARAARDSESRAR